MTFTISVIIPTYNNEETIERALSSVLAQTYPIHEVIIADDNSIDKTLGIVGSFSRRLNIKITKAQKPGGVSAARNRAIKIATGELIAFLDSDDEWQPHKTERQIQKFKSDPGIGIVSSYAEHYTPDGTYWKQIHKGKKPIEGPSAWKTLLEYNFVSTTVVIAKKSLIEQVGMFDKDLESGEDWDLWIKLAKISKVGFIFEPLAKQYYRSDSLERQQLHEKKNFTLDIISRHLKNYSDEITMQEKKKILAKTYLDLGTTLYADKFYITGFKFILKSILYAPKNLGQIKFLLSYSPVGRALKKLLGIQISIESNIYQSAQYHNTQHPLLFLAIDTEEEFDWSYNNYSKNNRSTQATEYLAPFQKVCDKHKIKPIYIMDYPITENSKAMRKFKSWQDQDQCEIGVHVHPWVNPPYEEEISQRNSYAGNLPFVLEHDKIKNLQDEIEKKTGKKPTIYKAGRYGFGLNTPKILKILGFNVDMSFLTHTNLRPQEGPDFSDTPSDPFWLDQEKHLLEIPMTRNFVGLLSSLGSLIWPLIDNPICDTLKIKGILSKLNFLERYSLTPEGITVKECKKLTQSCLNRGQKIFYYCFHSSTLMPGGSPYTKTQQDVDNFLQDIDDYLTFFKEEIKGEFYAPGMKIEELFDFTNTQETTDEENEKERVIA